MCIVGMSKLRSRRPKVLQPVSSRVTGLSSFFTKGQTIDKIFVMRLQVTVLTVVGLLLVPLNRLSAEPWVSNRYAQNCAACHAPGRVNLPSSERRCTLSCQACHVNPNGGGLRNLYGQWNQERWLRSFDSRTWKLGKEKPAPLADQPYTREKIDKFLATQGTKAEAARSQIVERGLRMNIASDDNLDATKFFNKHNSANENIIEPDRRRYMTLIPEGDPLREKEDRTIVAGGDFRYLSWTQTTSGPTGSTTDRYSIPMAADLGIQVSPVKKVSLVFESRFLNGPTSMDKRSAMDQLFTAGAVVRSAYIMVDDLWYNSWLMYGLYRPLFGNQNPDHANLMNSIVYGQNGSMRATYNALSVGTAPNVPFVNIHVLSPATDITYSQGRGTVVNLGARFVTLSASAVLSLWNTRATRGMESARNMTSLSVGGMLGPWIPVFDFVRVQRDLSNGQSDAGTVFSLENKVRLWRENYLVINYYQSNTAADLTAGNAVETQFGFKSFLLSGLEFELIMAQSKNTPASGLITNNRTLAQLHFFF